jgi:hypothetical protein
MSSMMRSLILSKVFDWGLLTVVFHELRTPECIKILIYSAFCLLPSALFLSQPYWLTTANNTIYLMFN